MANINLNKIQTTDQLLRITDDQLNRLDEADLLIIIHKINSHQLKRNKDLNNKTLLSLKNLKSRCDQLISIRMQKLRSH